MFRWMFGLGVVAGMEGKLEADGGVSLGARLEQYSLRYPQEVLLVTIAGSGGETEQVMVFKGFSSSLTGATAYDPDVPVVPEGAAIASIDRLRAPYEPAQPRYLEQGISWAVFEARLQGLGL